MRGMEELRDRGEEDEKRRKRERVAEGEGREAGEKGERDAREGRREVYLPNTRICVIYLHISRIPSYTITYLHILQNI